MKTWAVRIEWDCYFSDPDVVYTDIETEMIEQAAWRIWREWHGTGWDFASITGHGESGWIDLNAKDFNFERDRD